MNPKTTTDDPSVPDDDKLPEEEAEERFRRVVGNLVNTPHKPHAPLKGREPKPAPSQSGNRE